MAQLIVDGTTYPVPDGSDFTLGELADMEQVAGAPVDQLSGNSTRAMLALVYVVLRRHDPTVTVDRVRALRADQFTLEMNGDGPDPSGAGDPGPPTAADATSGLPA